MKVLVIGFKLQWAEVPLLPQSIHWRDKVISVILNINSQLNSYNINYFYN